MAARTWLSLVLGLLAGQQCSGQQCKSEQCQNMKGTYHLCALQNKTWVVSVRDARKSSR